MLAVLRTPLIDALDLPRRITIDRGRLHRVAACRCAGGRCRRWSSLRLDGAALCGLPLTGGRGRHSLRRRAGDGDSRPAGARTIAAIPPVPAGKRAGPAQQNDNTGSGSNVLQHGSAPGIRTALTATSDSHRTVRDIERLSVSRAASATQEGTSWFDECVTPNSAPRPSIPARHCYEFVMFGVISPVWRPSTGLCAKVRPARKCSRARSFAATGRFPRNVRSPRRPRYH
jgi:hypothetical protein